MLYLQFTDINTSHPVRKTSLRILWITERDYFIPPTPFHSHTFTQCCYAEKGQVIFRAPAAIAGTSTLADWPLGMCWPGHTCGLPEWLGGEQLLWAVQQTCFNVLVALL